MQEEDQIKRVLSYESTKDQWRGNYSSPEWQEASQLNADLYGLPLNRSANCHCVEDLFLLLHAMEQKTKPHINTINKVQMSERKFILKPGSVIQSHHFPANLDQNSSEEDLIKLLRINKKHADKFMRLPADWEKIVDAKEKAPTKPADKDQKAGKVVNLNPQNVYEAIDKMTATECREYAEKHDLPALKEKKTENLREELKGHIEAAEKPADKDQGSEDDEEAKADARYAERKASLIAEGWDDSDDVKFVKGEASVEKGEVYVATDEEYAALFTND